MVRLTITPVLLEALEYCSSLEDSSWADFIATENDPSLVEPVVGQAINHTQILGLSKLLRNHEQDGASSKRRSNVPSGLDSLLRGSELYIEPPKPKPEPTDEFKALMARLRAEEEARKYENLLNPNLHAQTFSQQFPNSPYTHLFPDSQAAGSRAHSSGGVLYDELSFKDINRQLALIANVLISIVACSVAIWWATWHWSTGWRLGASMSGSGLVGVAEVVVYMGYIARLNMAKEKEKKTKERKTVAKTWVIQGRKGVIEKRMVGNTDTEATGSAWIDAPTTIRRRGRAGS